MSRIFGTDGVRGIVDKDLTKDLAYNLGRAGAHVLTSGSRKPKILIGTDTRISKDMLQSALSDGIISVGAEAIIAGVIPTPAVSYLVKFYGCDAGVMISASHNPAEYNGIKFFDNNGYKLPDDLEDRIQYFIEEAYDEIPNLKGEDLGKKSIAENVINDYEEHLKSCIDVDLNGLKIALDCANGASYKIAEDVFKSLNAEVIVMGNKPDGLNINLNCGSTHLESLKKFVVENKCNVGFAFDGDADRCLSVDENGEDVNGDFIMAICADHLKKIGELNKNTLVTTVYSNMGLFMSMNKIGIRVVKTKNGDRYVLEEMLKEKYSLGGEQTGHIIFLKYANTGDGVLTSLQISKIMKYTNTKLSKLAKISVSFPQVLINVDVPQDKKEICYTDDDIVAKIKEVEEILGEKGRVLVRPSGTESYIRVMIEGEKKEEISDYAFEIKKVIESKL
ncbi:MAG: phosphoglucosamine mutase [Oscillospiraceae bacterium]|nr:phosphoglucosamine mutase [Oscillospiraceae bacterium]